MGRDSRKRFTGGNIGYCIHRNFHLNMICLMASTQVAEVVEQYCDKALIVEALCLCKAFGTDKLYLDTLKKLQATLFSSKDKRGQYDKLSAAIT